MPDDIRTRILAVREKSGFIPNVFLVLAHRPDEFRAFFAYHDALMDKPGNLTKAEREMIVVATSNLNQCQYCVVAHGAILRIRGIRPLEPARQCHQHASERRVLHNGPGVKGAAAAAEGSRRRSSRRSNFATTAYAKPSSCHAR
jgi:AhpD family alkylhydroperoxidase